MTTLVDDFNRANGSLGSIPNGGPAWQALNGAWSISNNRAYTSTSTSSNPLAVVETGSSDIDASLDVNGGDAIYFRVKDANNWLRLRVRRWTESYTTYRTEYEWKKTYNHNRSAAQHEWPDEVYNDPNLPTVIVYIWHTSSTSAPPSSAWPSSYQVDHWHYPDGFLRHTHEYSRGGGSGSYTGKTRQVASGSTSTTYYREYLEQCVNGTVSTIASSSSRTSAPRRIRVVTSGSTITCYRGSTGTTPSTQIISATSSTHLTETKHGIGRGTTSTNSQVLDNFTITISASRFVRTSAGTWQASQLHRRTASGWQLVL